MTAGAVGVGDVLAGKYRVTRVLGVGGMGMVVEAMHLDLEQKVALKFMLPEAMQSQHASDRFLREAKAAVMLRSEHVCRVLDVGKLENAAPYIVMEYMDGHDFAELIRRRGPLPVHEAVDYVLQALAGVAEAHSKQIVHRDLKPANLFVTTGSDGSPLIKVLDFGISKSTVSGSATKTGDILGSPSYMAPEQMMSSKNVDGRADVWAFGVILYEAVTGQLPFTGESLPVLCMSVLHDEPIPPVHHRPDLDAAFSALILKCLDKRLDHRFPDVQSLANALAPFGGPSAVVAAGRIARMRGRAMSPAVGYAETVGPSSGPVTAPVAPAVASSPAQGRAFGVLSTLQSSAGEKQPRAAASNRKWLVLAGGATTLVAAVVTFVLVSSSHSRTSTRPAAAAGQPPATAPLPAGSDHVSTAPPATSGSSAPPAGSATPPQVSPPSSPSTSAQGGSATSTPVATPTAVTTPTAKPKPKPKPKPVVKPSTPSCDPPYVVDATGKRTYKPECL